MHSALKISDFGTGDLTQAGSKSVDELKNWGSLLEALACLHSVCKVYTSWFIFGWVLSQLVQSMLKSREIHHFIKSDGAFKLEGGRKSVKETKNNGNKTLKHYLAHKHLCILNHLRSIFSGNN